MEKTRIRPVDFIKNFSPFQKAELYIQIEKKNRILSNPVTGWTYRQLRKFYLEIIGSPNDQEVKKAWAYIRQKWTVVSPKKISSYLEEKFAGDHLRKFEYVFEAKCLMRKDVKNDIIVDLGGGFSYSTIVPVLFGLPFLRLISIDVIRYTGKSKYGIEYHKGNCTKINLPDDSVDIVCLISTLEHVGLGRYGDPYDVDGDIKTMRQAKRILNPGGHVILTIPYGYPTVVFNLHRVYDQGRFNKLIEGFKPILLKYSLLGKETNRKEVEGKKVTKFIPGYYTDIPVYLRHLDPQGGLMVLLKKM